MGKTRENFYALFAASALAAGCQQGQRPTLLDEGKTISGKAVEILEEIDTLPNKDLILKGNLPLYEKGLEVRKFGGYDIEVNGESNEKRISEEDENDEIVVGKAVELSREISISDEDIKTVVAQTGATTEAAKESIKKHKGDLAAAIMDIKQ